MRGADLGRSRIRLPVLGRSPDRVADAILYISVSLRVSVCVCMCVARLHASCMQALGSGVRAGSVAADLSVVSRHDTTIKYQTFFSYQNICVLNNLKYVQFKKIKKGTDRF